MAQTENSELKLLVWEKRLRTSYWTGKKVIGLVLIVPKKVLYIPREQEQSCWITMRKSLYLGRSGFADKKFQIP